MAKTLWIRRGRRWLNRIGFESSTGGGSVCWSVSHRVSSNGKHYVNTSLNIRDCTDSVDLECYATELDEREASEYKLTVLINELTSMREAIRSLPEDLDAD